MLIMDKVQGILNKYLIAMENNDMLEMIELIEEMKEVDPAFVDLMITSVDDDEDEDEE
jgi:hypothetical protein